MNKMNSKPYNVFLSAPTINVQSWSEQALQWITLGREVGAAAEFSPLTLKALYVTGIVRHSCESVSILLGKGNLISTTYYPAYVVFASAIELLGRCIRGNDTPRNNTLDLETGFKWLASPSANNYQSISQDQTLISTIVNPKYSIKDLVDLRHFEAHGQAINQSSIHDFDYLLLGEMPSFVAKGMENYLSELRSSGDLCNHLAQASITPFRNRPIFDGIWGLQADVYNYPSSVARFIEKQDWTDKYEGPKLTFV
jgi:hypothetical protein